MKTTILSETNLLINKQTAADRPVLLSWTQIKTCVSETDIFLE